LAAVESANEVRTLENASDMLSRSHVVNALNVERTEQGKATYFVIRILGKVNDCMFLDPVVRKFSILLETLCALKAALKLLSLLSFASRWSWHGYDLQYPPFAALCKKCTPRDSNALISRKRNQ
jgi:hypothetical protein